MAFCIKCGTQLADDANFCAKCGTPVQTAAQSSSPTKVKLTLDNVYFGLKDPAVR